MHFFVPFTFCCLWFIIILRAAVLETWIFLPADFYRFYCFKYVGLCSSSTTEVRLLTSLPVKKNLLKSEIVTLETTDLCRTKTPLHRFFYGSLDRYERSLLSLMLVIHPLNTQVVLTQHREKVHQVLLKLTVRAHGSDQVTLTKQLLTELGVIVSVHILTLYKMEYKLPFTVSYLTKFLY